MKLYKGNMFNTNIPSLQLVSCNNVINNDGSLVMGAGVAKEAVIRNPGLDYVLGHLVQKEKNSTGFYGVVVDSNKFQHHVGAFQSKYHFREKSSYELIEASAYKLIRFIEASSHYIPILMNIPGTGLGGLDREKVLSLISFLPDNVTVCEL